MAKKIIAFMVVALFIGGIIGYYVAKPYDDIARLESEVSTLQSDYTHLFTLYNQLNGNYAELKQLLERRLSACISHLMVEPPVK